MKKITKRNVIKELLNRKRVYSIRDYVRTVNSLMKKTFTSFDILKTLQAMSRELILCYSINNNKIDGFTFSKGL